MNNEWIKQVTEFQITFENPAKNYKTLKELIKHRAKLIKEECDEFLEAAKTFETRKEDDKEGIESLKEMLDAICDMTVINIGTANLLGFDMEEAMRRVHESNMSKLGADGKPIYNQEGKVQKGPNYHKPQNLEECMNPMKMKNFFMKCKKAKEEKKTTKRKIKIYIMED